MKNSLLETAYDNLLYPTKDIDKSINKNVLNKIDQMKKLHPWIKTLKNDILNITCSSCNCSIGASIPTINEHSISIFCNEKIFIFVN